MPFTEKKNDNEENICYNLISGLFTNIAPTQMQPSKCKNL